MTNDELIVRLEAADGPDRELDAAILLFVNGYTMHEDSDPKDGIFAYWEGEPWDSVCCNCSRWLEVTASIDAALTLVPEGWTGFVAVDAGNETWLWPKNSTMARGFRISHKVPAIGLTIAALKAQGGRDE